MALAQKETAIDRYFSDYEDGTLDNGDSTAHKKGSAPTENLVGARNPSPEGVRERSPLVELMTAYLNLTDQVGQLRNVLVQPMSADAPADE